MKTGDVAALCTALEHAEAIAAEQQSAAFVSRTRDGYAVAWVDYPREGQPLCMVDVEGLITWHPAGSTRSPDGE